jgi:PfaB family protein
MNPIAIIGISCLFPSADTSQKFWQLLKRGERATTDITSGKIGIPAHLLPDGFFDPARQQPDTSYFLHGGYITDDLTADFPKHINTATQWLGYTAQTALSDSGYTGSLSRVGLVAGNLTMPTVEGNHLITPIYQHLFAKSLNLHPLDHPSAHLANGLSPAYPSAVVAHHLGLGLGGFTLDAACGSSLYAIKIASDYLNSGRADMMLAGAVCASDPLFINMGFAHLGGFPESWEDSLPLDRRSGGLIAGEGAGMVVLKRYDDAVRDGDTIHAIIHGVGVANDGAGKHILTPNSKGQATAFRRAYDQAGLSPDGVQYIECHASGTTVGDKTELRSMGEFFQNKPSIGSVKSNIGHLMTVAGMASLLKLILSLANEEIPSTIRIREPLTLFNGFGAEQVVTAPQNWTASQPRIGAINAFGFGGVSAHLVLSDHNHRTERTTVTNQPLKSIAITGMGAHFGKFDDLSSFARALFDGETALRDLPASRWKGLEQHPDLLSRFGLNSAPKGGYIDAFDLDFVGMKIPPNPNDEPIPQQLLLLKVADQAIRDAGLKQGENVAVIVALGTELTLHQYRARADLNWQLGELLNNNHHALSPEQETELRTLLKDSLLTPAQVNHYTSYIGNLTASRVASLWDFSGSAFTVSAEENSVFKALELAQMMLEKNEVSAVVVGAVDLAGSLESVITRNARTPLSDNSAVGFDSTSNGWLVGEGAGAVVLQRADQAGDHAYAVINALSFSTQAQTDADGLPVAPTIQAVQEATTNAFNQAGITPEQIGYVELHASGIALEDQTEINALTRIYRGASAETALGSVKANVGHTFIASGMASLIKTALTLAYRFIPAVPNWDQPKYADQWAGTPFWVAPKSRTWFDAERHAAINSLSADGTATHVILSNAQNSVRQADYLSNGLPVLALISGNNQAELTQKLTALLAQVNDDSGLNALVDQLYSAYQADHAYCVALVAKNSDALRQEIDRALTGVPQAIAQGADWSTPAGSAFSAQPVGQSGSVAFVYPGAFNSYPKMGQELFHLFPSTLDALAEVKSDLGEAVAERLLYPRSLSKPDAKLTRTMKTALTHNAIATIESGLSFALIYTRAMQDIFGVKPASAFGYSLGEGSMMWGIGLWKDGDAGSANFHKSTLFTNRLVDPMNAVRQAWGIPSDVPTSEFWAAHFISAPASQVKALVENENRVYLTHINTPNEVMIAGDPAGCERVINQLDAESMKAPFSVVIHADVMMGEYGEFYNLHNLPVTPVPEVKLYSAADYAPLTQSREVVANNISRMACKQIDFPRLIRNAYQDGARAFIELGPRSTAARWISETLGDLPHVAVSIDNMASDSRTSLIRALAQFVAHRVPMNLSALYNELAPANGKSLVRKVQLGGSNIYNAIQAGLSDIPVQLTQTPAPVQQVAQTSATPLPERIHDVHADFLQSRKAGLRGIADLITAQIEAFKGGRVPDGQAPIAMPSVAPQAAQPQLPPPPAPNPLVAPSIREGIEPLYPYEAIDTFALRRIADTFGERYAIYDGRRAPRIPNGDLLLISRVVKIEGERYKPGNGTNILAEYDVPVDAWFYQDSPYPTMPYSVLMEIALQPCGILSAYHGPTFAYPDADLYFRNLDGDGTLIKDVDMRGRTITNHVTMLSHASIGGSILQKYRFNLYDDGELFYTGTAVFGYFTSESLASRAGLDAGKSRDRWIDTEQPTNVHIIADPQSIGAGYLRLGKRQLDLIHEARVVLDGGHYAKGYAYARTDIDTSMWFFKNHFFQDPVMPGSIGVETMLEALQSFAIHSGLTAEMPDGHFAHPDANGTPDGHKVDWRYRGQVLGSFKATHVEVNVKEIRRSENEIIIIADGSLWRENLRIYEVNNLGLAIRR